MVEVDRDFGGMVPIEGTFGLIMTISATGPTVCKAILCVGHPLIGGVVLDPTKLEARDEEVVGVPVTKVIDGACILDVKVVLGVHLQEHSLVLGL